MHDRITTLPHNGTRIVAQADPAANPAEPGRMVPTRVRATPSHARRRHGRRILQTVGATVRSGGNANTVRKP